MITKIQSLVVGFVGAGLILLPVKALYIAQTTETRVLFHPIAMVIAWVLGFFFLQTPYLIFRRYGKRALIQLWVCTVLAAIIVADSVRFLF